MGVTSYSTDHYMAASSSMAAGFLPSDLLTFGFAALGLRVYNACADRVFFNLQTSATTVDGWIAGCSEMKLEAVAPATTLSLNTTTTSSAAQGRGRVSVSAWQSA